ncbi:MAG TPA: DUF4112 domain-containing protein [Opitutales bacterium]|nr:DUF4112 domain-containing protein [Opitutales bacterium]
MPDTDLPPHTDARRVALRRVRRFARLLDANFGVPGTRLRFGWDGIIGLLPGADSLTALPA